ncbi:MAG: hypothetical protein LBI54_02710 [Lachnospiraceae bacterium]|jgi:hypothetical protein|nr:hypothetical protein [Lachnospiraceae bacterium]
MSYEVNSLKAYSAWDSPYIVGYVPGAVKATSATATIGISIGGAEAAASTTGSGEAGKAEKSEVVRNPGADPVKKPGRTSAPAECKTCANRRYVDGSDENVSFKAPTKISPEAAAGAVRAHEGEHVANAFQKAAKNGGEVISANVSIKTAICPECGRSYVSGGETTTKIRYTNEEQPYQQNRKKYDAASLVGMNIDVAA